MAHGTHACDATVTSGTRAGDGVPEVAIRPAPETWRGLIGRARADETARLFRRELGLPEDRPVIMSGHQAQVWHPGILAKLLALDGAAGSLNACAAWVVVDHDDNDSLALRAPYITSEGRLAVQTLGPTAQAAPDVPACRQPAWAAGGTFAFPAGGTPAAPGVNAGLEHIRAALARNASSSDAASQVAAATIDLARPLAATPVMVRATALARTELFANVVARMRRDPRACADAHNAAVRAFPHDRVAPLAVDTAGGNHELPLWTIGTASGSKRNRVYANELETVDVLTLAPRALLLTGLMRRAGCDLFIHGTGGERYDRITDLWLRTWLGESLAPTAMVTASLRLRVPGCWPSAAHIARAAWTAHRALHDPALVGDPASASAKRSLVERIRAARYKSRERSDLFLSLHALLDRSRREHADALAALVRDAAAMRSRAGEAGIAADRTWPFPLYEADQLLALRDAVRARFAQVP